MSRVIGRWQRTLALKRLWLTHAYPFYWAHKPLCGRFRQDVVRVGHVHLCRSCLLAYTGMAVGIATCVGNPTWLQVYGVLVFSVLATATVLLSLPLWYKRWPRPMRDVLRFSMGLTIPLCGYVLFSGHIVTGIVGAVVLVAFWRFYLTLRRARRLESCAGCSELGTQSICSGYCMQAGQLRVYEEKATAWVMAHETGCPRIQGQPGPPAS